MRPQMGVEVAAATDIGPRRKTNADGHVVDEAAGLLAVADGMGDTPRAAAIAGMALQAVLELFAAPWALLPHGERSIGEAAERLWLGIQQANGRLHVPGRRETDRTITTFVGVVLCSRHFCVAHAGDSRAYVMRGGAPSLLKLTRDHTVHGDAVARGLPRKVAAELPNAGALTRAIGARPSLDVWPAIRPWAAGDTLLLCSNGISNWLRSEEMAGLLVGHANIEDAAQGLVARALMAGSRDNATAVVARRRT